MDRSMYYHLPENEVEPTDQARDHQLQHWQCGLGIGCFWQNLYKWSNKIGILQGSRWPWPVQLWKHLRSSSKPRGVLVAENIPIPYGHLHTSTIIMLQTKTSYCKSAHLKDVFQLCLELEAKETILEHSQAVMAKLKGKFDINISIWTLYKGRCNFPGQSLCCTGVCDWRYTGKKTKAGHFYSEIPLPIVLQDGCRGKAIGWHVWKSRDWGHCEELWF